jgi:hypothetical protein
LFAAAAAASRTIKALSECIFFFGLLTHPPSHHGPGQQQQADYLLFLGNEIEASDMGMEGRTHQARRQHKKI